MHFFFIFCCLRRSEFTHGFNFTFGFELKSNGMCIKFSYTCKCNVIPLSEAARLTFEGGSLLFVNKICLWYIPLHLFTVCSCALFMGPNLVFREIWKLWSSLKKMTAQFMSNWWRNKGAENSATSWRLKKHFCEVWVWGRLCLIWIVRLLACDLLSTWGG